MSTLNVFFIDSRVSDYQTLIPGLPADSIWFLLNADEDGVAQMASILKGYSELDSIQVISHGSAGTLYLGSTVLESSNLSDYQSQFKSIGSSLTENGDILLYGCNVATGPIGMQFITSFADVTGADVAGSNDLTGSAVRGGNWSLEVGVGAIDAGVLALPDYRDILAVNTAPTFLLSDGTVTTHIAGGGYAWAVTVQPDGKIVVAGISSGPSNGGVASGSDQLLVRYNPDGSLDTSFSNDGIVLTDVSDTTWSNDWVGGIALQADGKIVIAGTFTNYLDPNYGAAIVRYNSDGTLDSSFSGDGFVRLLPGGRVDMGARCLAIQVDGKILIAGLYDADKYSYGGDGCFVARLNSDGSLDSSFSDDGILVQPVNMSISEISIQDDGKIVIAGDALVDSTSRFIKIARFNSNGTLDVTFSDDGVVETHVGDRSSVSAIAVTSDGKILVTGETLTNLGTTAFDFVVVRYNSNGSLDSTFSGDGIVTTDFGGASATDDRAYGISVQNNGDVVVVGDSSAGGGFYYSSTFNTSVNSDFAIARYSNDGSLVTTFGNDGKVLTDYGSYSDHAFGVYTQSDGSIVAVGSSFDLPQNRPESEGHDDVAMARYSANGKLDLTFNVVQRLGGTVTYTENGGDVYLDQQVKVVDSELLSSGSYAGSTLTLARHASPNSEDVFIAGWSLNPFTEGGVLVHAGVIIGTVTKCSQGTLGMV